jgi:hypothetical protein
MSRFNPFGQSAAALSAAKINAFAHSVALKAARVATIKGIATKPVASDAARAARIARMDAKKV